MSQGTAQAPSTDDAGSRGAEDARQGRSPEGRGREREPIPILGLVRYLAALAVLAALLGRALGPSWAGIAVGMDRLIRAMEVVGGLATQLFAMAATVVAMAEILVLTRIHIAIFLRVTLIAIAGSAIIIGLSASAMRVPELPLAVVGTGVAVIALASAWDARRAPFTRPAAAILALIAAGALVRLAGVALAFMAASRASAPLAAAARGVATGAFILDACALFGVMAVVAAAGKKVASPLTTLALVLAFLATRQAMVGAADDAGVVSLLIRRAADRLLTRPEPFLPAPVQVFVGFLALFAAAAVVFVRGQVPALAGVLALALVARGSADMPLGALVLIIASMSLVLAARDDRGLWAAITASEARDGRAGDRAGEARAPSAPPAELPPAADDRERDREP